MPAAVAVDTTIAVVTPENIAFDYQLAGPFRRLPAYVIDVAVRWILLLIMVVFVWLVSGLVPLSGLTSFAEAFMLIAYFVMTNFYGTVMESSFNGKTFGKWSCGIRAINVDGSPITLRGAFLRNLLRVADLAPYAVVTEVIEDAPPIFLLPTGIFGVVVMILTERMQRLGDLAAGTMVIVDEREWRLPKTKMNDPRVPALASYLPGDFEVSRTMARTLAVYAERRNHLTPGRRREIAKKLTVPLAERFGFRNDIDPDLMMMAMYHQHFLHDSETKSVDLGPLAGFSPMAKNDVTDDVGTPDPQSDSSDAIVAVEIAESSS